MHISFYSFKYGDFRPAHFLYRHPLVDGCQMDLTDIALLFLNTNIDSAISPKFDLHIIRVKI